MDLSHIQQTRTRILPYIQKTPLIRCYGYEYLYLKCEHLQMTASFKVRGAFNAMLKLDPEEKKRGVITRSMGNFAQAVAYAGQLLHIPATIILPSNVPKIKKEGVDRYKARAILQAGGSKEEQKVVEKIAREEHLTILSPYNIPAVIEGAGTLALEIHEQLPSIHTYFGQIGGGGLMAGSSFVFKHLNPSIRTIAVEPEGANDYFLSRGKDYPIFLDNVDTIADGLRAPQVGDVPWPYLQKYVDHAETVSDREIIAAMHLLYDKMGMIIEPSGATSLAAALRHCKTHREPTVCVLTGANVDRSSFFEWINLPA